jgi:hypothetical protein
LKDLIVPWLCLLGVVIASIAVAVITTIKSEAEG